MKLAKLAKRASAVLLFGLTLSTAITASCKVPGYRAGTLNRSGVAALRIGLSESEIIDALGSPVTRVKEKELSLLAYAKPSHRQVLSRRFGEAGLTFIVYVHRGQMQSAYIHDPQNRAVCSCNAKACPRDWTSACLTLFPLEREASTSQAAGS